MISQLHTDPVTQILIAQKLNELKDIQYLVNQLFSKLLHQEKKKLRNTFKKNIQS